MIDDSHNGEADQEGEMSKMVEEVRRATVSATCDAYEILLLSIEVRRNAELLVREGSDVHSIVPNSTIQCGNGEATNSETSSNEETVGERSGRSDDSALNTEGGII